MTYRIFVHGGVLSDNKSQGKNDPCFVVWDPETDEDTAVFCHNWWPADGAGVNGYSDWPDGWKWKGYTIRMWIEVQGRVIING